MPQSKKPECSLIAAIIRKDAQTHEERIDEIHEYPRRQRKASDTGYRKPRKVKGCLDETHKN